MLVFKRSSEAAVHAVMTPRVIVQAVAVSGTSAVPAAPPKPVPGPEPIVIPVVMVAVVMPAVFLVVAPTVPLMLIDAVPVRFVTVPLLGVPRTGVVKLGLVIVCTPVKVFAASVRATVQLVDGNVIVVASVPAKVKVLLTVRVLLVVPPAML